MTFGEALAEVEEKQGRRLSVEEIELLGRMVDADKDIAEILAVLGEEVPPPPSEENVETYRYEATGSGVVRIPDTAVEDEGGTG